MRGAYIGGLDDRLVNGVDPGSPGISRADGDVLTAQTELDHTLDICSSSVSTHPLI